MTINQKNIISNFTFFTIIIIIGILTLIFLSGCNLEQNNIKDDEVNKDEKNIFIDELISISYNGIVVDAFVNKYYEISENEEVDVIVAYHGTAIQDSKIRPAARSLGLKIRDKILNNESRNIIIISVAYPEENLLMGDNVVESEAALLWIKNNASNVLKLNINKIFLFGHSQGAYIVTRLNTMHETEGVISNSPGPLDLISRCSVDEQRSKNYINPPKLSETGYVCYLLYEKYGTTKENPDAYMQRSGISFVSNYQSDILFIQGMDDPNPFQQKGWPEFIKAVENSEHKANYEFLNIEGFGHRAVFESEQAKKKVLEFLAKN